jgi:hypothetical protein
MKRIDLARPVDHDLPFSNWSLPKLADFLVAEGVVDDITPRDYACCSARRASAFKP